MTDVRVDNPADFPPQEDTVERLWTPQRMTYVLRNREDRPTKPKTQDCPFCVRPKRSDEDGLIAWRG
ncbi:MAG: HIT domain-containing protein, partial [Bifidobacterium sp.]|nr:HIT domain-containing protein [Bifidobacterium sp.]